MAKDQTFPVDYSQRIAIVAALRKAFEKCKHYEKFTKRIKPFVEAELPEYTIHIETSGAFPGVSVWGNGISHDGAVRISWCEGVGKQTPWQEKFAYDLDRNDPSDSAERQALEIKLEPKIATLSAKVEALRQEAQALIDTLPVPTSAKTREDNVFWRRASYSLQDKYPLLFKPAC